MHYVIKIKLITLVFWVMGYNFFDFSMFAFYIFSKIYTFC